MQSKLHLQQTCGILSIKIKIEVVEVGVVLVFIPNFSLLKGVYPPILRPLHPHQVQELAAVGDGGDGLGRAWVLEVILQLVGRAGKKPPRRAWVLLHVGPREVPLRPIRRRGRSPLSGTNVGALRRKDKPLEAIFNF